MSTRDETMKAQFRVTVVGCDDSTSIEIELTTEEAALVQRIAERITAASSYGCMPRMTVEVLTGRAE